MSKATLIFDYVEPHPRGGYSEIVVWRVPVPVPPSSHGFKYRLAFVVDGVCRIRYDNERGKGDHMHVDAVERPYAFVDIDTLISEFLSHVDRWCDDNK